MEFESRYNIFHAMKLIKNVVCKMAAILSRPQCVNLRGSIIIIITKAVSTAAAVLTMRTNIIIHCCDVIIGAIASQITNPMIVYSTVYCPASRTTLVATRFRVAVICPIIQVPHCIRVFFYFV